MNGMGRNYAFETQWIVGVIMWICEAFKAIAVLLEPQVREAIVVRRV